MTYAFPYQQSYQQTTMMSSPNKFQHSVLARFPDCGSNSYKSLLMYPAWQWPPTPESLSPSVRLPHINRFSSMPPIPSPLTPGTPTTAPPLCTAEPLSPIVRSVPTSMLTPNSSPSLNVTMVAQHPKESTLVSTPTGSKRGRPRADVISSLQYFGSNSTCSIRCHICHRVFPREKSLQAHLRTHTGERPYRCDYPNCTKSFVQSGQLKTHQRLHSGEKPFKCSDEECSVRFTHANRHCPDHPHAKLLRDDQGALEGLLVGTARQDTAIAEWLDKYVRTRLDRTNSLQQHRPQYKRESTETYTSSDEEVNSPKPAAPMPNKVIEPIIKIPLLTEPKASSVKRQLLSDENEVANNDERSEPAVRIPLSPKRINQNGQVLKIDPRHPVKKRILAYNQFMMKENQEQQLKAASLDVPTLQRPHPTLPPVNNASPKQRDQPDCKKSPVAASSPTRGLVNKSKDVKSTPVKYSFLQDLKSLDVSTQDAKSSHRDNSSKPTFSSSVSPLPRRYASGDDEPSDRWNGAIALMQLASSPPSRKMSNSSNDH